MTRRQRKKAITRRHMLAYAGLAAAGVAVGYGGLKALDDLASPASKPALQDVPDVVSAKIEDTVPTEEGSGAWKKAKAVRVALAGQQVILPLKPEPSVPSVEVRSLHDGGRVAFRLEWTDEREDDLSIKIDQFRDACGVLLGAYPASPTVWLMGAPDSPATILQWRADWQRDVDLGFQDLEVAFPNVAFDFYPPLVNAAHPLKLPDAYPKEARMWLPGWRVGNPLSQPVKQSPVHKLRAIGPGTLEAQATQDARGKGVWEDGKWKVVLIKPMKASDKDEMALSPGSTYSLAFTVWSGSDRDVGSRKSLTQLGKLTLEA